MPQKKNQLTPDQGESIRKRSLRTLTRQGFRVALGLPLPHKRASVGTGRPVAEIAKRMFAIDAVFSWASAMTAPDERIMRYVERNKLRSAMTPDEAQIFKLTRAQARKRHIDEIGWKLENIWPLAWLLGFPKPPTPWSATIPRPVHKKLYDSYLPSLDSTLKSFLAGASPQGYLKIVEMEDLFYCADNAVVSAMLGKSTIPKDIDSVTLARAVRARRHSLTWSISRNVKWQDTDLNT